MKRSLDALAALLGIRRPGVELFRHASGTLVARDLLSRADLLAQRLPAAGQRIVVPSDDPLALLAGIAGCWLSENTAVAWRQSAIDIASLTGLTAAAASIRWDNLANDWHIDRLPAAPTIEQPGDLIILTSGSTGKPKGVALDLGRLVLNAVLTAGKVDVSSCDFWAIDADMSLMSPLGHTLMAWSSQVCVQHLAGLDWTARSELFARARGGYGGAPLQIRELAQRLLGTGPHVIVSSGDFLPPALGKAIETRFPEAKLHKIYGLTEVSGRLCVLPHPQRQLDPAAAGFPLPGFDVFTDATDDDKDIAEICVRGPTMMHGYWRPGGSFEPAAGSVFRTGDLGSVRSDGLVTVNGRRDDVFKVGAEKVDRHSIEEALRSTLADHEFCVLPVIHPLLGQTPALFVASLDEQSLPLRATLVQAVRSRLPPRYTPSLALWVGKALPKLPNGKLDKQRLIREFADYPDLHARPN